MHGLDELDAWLERLQGAGVDALHLERRGFVVHVVKRVTGEVEPVDRGFCASESAHEHRAPEARVLVRAPVSGVFYRAVAPEARPFVVVGDVVRLGQVVGLLESVKLMNECRAHVSGRITRIFAADGEAVDVGSPLIELEPDAAL